MGSAGSAEHTTYGVDYQPSRWRDIYGPYRHYGNCGRERQRWNSICGVLPRRYIDWITRYDKSIQHRLERCRSGKLRVDGGGHRYTWCAGIIDRSAHHGKWVVQK